MKNAWISIAGLIAHYPDVLDNFALPAAADIVGPGISDDPWVPEKADLINYICWELSELPLVYSDPISLKIAVEYWSKAQLKTWTELLKTLNYTYNPVWNKDGSYTERRDTGFNNTGSTTNTGTVKTDQDTTDTGTVGRSGSSSGSTENQVTGYDTNAYSPNKKDLTSSSASETTTNNLAGTNDVTVTNNLSESRADGGTGFEVVARTETGNIGVTTTQQMIKEQRDLVQLNYYDFLTQAFKREFCVMVW